MSHFTAHVAGWALAGVLIALFLAYALLVIGALVSALRSPLSGGMKLVWCVLVFVAPFLGSLLWFVIGRPNAYSPRMSGDW